VPSTSKKQHNFMEAIAHNKAFAKKVGVPQSVGEDFVAADKGKHFKKGGTNMATRKRINPAAAMMAARAMQAPAPMMAPPQGAMPAPGGMKEGGLSKEHHKHLAHHHLAMAEHHMKEHEGHHKMKKMASGGKAESMGPRSMKEDVEKGSNKETKFGESKVQKRGHTEDRHPKMKEKGLNDIGTEGMKHGGKVKKMAHGGSTSARADGAAVRGKTKTKYC